MSFILIFSNSVAVPFRWLLKGRITEQNQTIEHTYITLMKHKLSRTSSSKFVALKQLYNKHLIKFWSHSSPGIFEILIFLVWFCWKNVKFIVMWFYSKLKEVPVKLPIILSRASKNRTYCTVSPYNAVNLHRFPEEPSSTKNFSWIQY